MDTMLFWMFMFLDMLTFIMFADVILSWLTMMGIKFSPQFLAWMIDPIYWMIKKVMPTTIWPMDFTPMVVLLVVYFFKWLLIMNFPQITDQMNLYISLLK